MANNTAALLHNVSYLNKENHSSDTTAVYR